MDLPKDKAQELLESQSRRNFLKATGGLAAVVGIASGQLGGDNQGNISGGTMALEEAYQISDKQWIGPDSAKANVEAKSGRLYKAVDTEVEYYGDSGSWTGPLSVGSSSQPVPSVSTDRIGNAHWIKSGDDAQTIIENAGSDSMFFLDPGATFDAANIQFPENHLVIGQGATFKKAADGPIATVGRDSYMVNVSFDGNKADFTGDGVVDGLNDAYRLQWNNVEIFDVTGDARVHDGRSRHQYNVCRFYFADGYGLVETHSDTDSGATDVRCRRGAYRECFISGNGKGAVKWETSIEDMVYRIRAGANAGACFEFRPSSSTDYLEGVTLDGTYQNNDGPFFYMFDGACRMVDCSAHVKDSNEAIANTPMSAEITSPIGQIHFEGANSVDRFQISGGHIRTGGTDNAATISGQSGVAESVFISGGDGPSGESITGSSMLLSLIGSDQNNWNMSLNVDQGLHLSYKYGDRAYLQDLTTGDRKWFGRIDARSLSSPHQGDRAVHNGSGSNTEGPAYYNGSAWISVVDGTTIS